MQEILEKKYGNISVVRNETYQWGVIGSNDNIIVPFGKYDWIDGFDSGLARVVIDGKISNINRWGLIDVNGYEVLPLEYDSIWNFYNKGRNTTRVVKDGKKLAFNLRMLSFVIQLERYSYKKEKYSHRDYSYDEPEHYEEYAGSYVQEYEGWSDEMINDALDGDPEAYWNID